MSRFKVSGRSPRRVKPGEHAIDTPFIRHWLERPNDFVTRQELYEFVSRLERGRARANTLPRRIGWALKRAWAWAVAPVVRKDGP